MSCVEAACASRHFRDGGGLPRLGQVSKTPAPVSQNHSLLAGSAHGNHPWITESPRHMGRRIGLRGSKHICICKHRGHLRSELHGQCILRVPAAIEACIPSLCLAPQCSIPIQGPSQSTGIVTASWCTPLTCSELQSGPPHSLPDSSGSASPPKHGVSASLSMWHQQTGRSR